MQALDSCGVLGLRDVEREMGIRIRHGRLSGLHNLWDSVAMESLHQTHYSSMHDKVGRAGIIASASWSCNYRRFQV